MIRHCEWKIVEWTVWIFYSITLNDKVQIAYLPDDSGAGIDGPRSAWPDRLANDWLDRLDPDWLNESDPKKAGPVNPIGAAAAGAAIGADSEIGCEKPPPCWA